MTSKTVMMMAAAGLLGALGCVPQPQQAPPQYYGGGQPQYAPQPPMVAPGGQPQQRQISFNGRAATAGDWQVIAQLERAYGKLLPNGSYWYDAMSGAAGAWGGPVLGVLPAGLELGGQLPANASGGGRGQLTGVFINGREIHPQDAQFLMQLLGQVVPGRYWVDGQGNAGIEGGAAQINLYAVARQRAQQSGGGGNSYYRSDGSGNNVFVGGGCVSVSGTTGSGDSKSSYSYYGSGC